MLASVGRRAVLIDFVAQWGYVSRKEVTPLAEQKSSTSDPFAAWRDWLTQFERQVNAFFNEQMASDGYNRFMAQTNQFLLDSQKTTRDMVARSLSSLNLPTTEDWTALSQRVATVEERLRALEISLGRSDGARTSELAQSSGPRPPRTRKPPSSGGTRKPASSGARKTASTGGPSS
jgi:hypothetical protein